ncbi:thioredoxin family protein [Desulfatirhabdium butyrativorans]|uniref:thioredoxin family protein n=1 Tax=Desulfatirhabdium butyrativorans TaxID=340467 RepID=UPI00041F89AA|nr:thioredoxin family protein [Desulfatirhabdium butyrativorans]
MPSYDVKQIMVGGQRTGIIGLDDVLKDVASEFVGRSDAEIEAELLARLSKKNYIYDKIKDQYAKAFLREYKKFVEEPFEEAKSDCIQIKILGPGCPNCRKLEQDVMALVAENHIQADIEHVTDLKDIASYGVIGSPALIIDGIVMAVGNMPQKSKLMEWLVKAAGERK